MRTTCWAAWLIVALPPGRGAVARRALSRLHRLAQRPVQPLQAARPRRQAGGREWPWLWRALPPSHPLHHHHMHALSSRAVERRADVHMRARRACVCEQCACACARMRVRVCVCAMRVALLRAQGSQNSAAAAHAPNALPTRPASPRGRWCGRLSRMRLRAAAGGLRLGPLFLWAFAPARRHMQREGCRAAVSPSAAGGIMEAVPACRRALATAPHSPEQNAGALQQTPHFCVARARQHAAHTIYLAPFAAAEKSHQKRNASFLTGI